MFGTLVPTADRRPGWIALALAASLMVAAPLSAQTEEAAAQAQAEPAARLFASDGGMVLNFIKPDRTADFEAVMAKLKEALQNSDKPERQQQAASWKVFRSPDPAAGGNVLYVFVIDPSVKDADYTVSTILAEGFPGEVQELFKQYADAYASGQNFVNLTLVTDLGR